MTFRMTFPQRARTHRVLVVALTLCFSIAARAQSVLPPATESEIRELLNAPQFADAHIGICIENLGIVVNNAAFPSRRTGAPQTLFAQDADKRFLPASNMKLFTAAIALQTLGENKTFATTVFASSTRNGGALYLRGGGDPSLTIADLKQLARDVRRRGITRVRDVFADDSLFRAEGLGGRYPDGWTLDDALWYYGPEASALALERNQIDITIEATKVGQTAKVTVSPQLPGFALGREISVDVQTVALPATTSTTPVPSIQFDRADARSAIGAKLTVRGQIALGKTATEGIAVPNIARIAALAFARELRAAGIEVGGRVDARVLPTKLVASPTTLARHDSAPLRVLVQRFLKKSDNLYGEMFLRSVGVAASSTRSMTSSNTSVESVSNGVSSVGAAALGHGELLRWLQLQNVTTSSLRLSDGSGLSRYNLLTPRAVVELLRAVDATNQGAFYDALPIAGVDGTLANRMKDTAAANNVRAKTGTFSIANCLSGYVTTRDNRRLAVSVMTNFVRDGSEARRLQNEIMIALAATSW